jgi:hypothetical protein
MIDLPVDSTPASPNQPGNTCVKMSKAGAPFSDISVITGKVCSCKTSSQSSSSELVQDLQLIVNLFEPMST